MLVEAPWTETDARLEFRSRAEAVAVAVKDAQAACGDALTSFACVLTQEAEPGSTRLQVWRRAGMPEELRELLTETAPPDETGRLPIVLWALDGNLWIMWSRVYLAAPGGTA